jgi:hypothetical protein
MEGEDRRQVCMRYRSEEEEDNDDDDDDDKI